MCSSAISPSGSRRGGSADSTACIIARTTRAGSPGLLTIEPPELLAHLADALGVVVDLTLGPLDGPRGQEPGAMRTGLVHLVCQRLGEAFDAELARGVVRPTHQPLYPVERRHLEQMATALTTQVRQRRARHVDHTEEVDLELLTLLLVGELLDRVYVAEAGVVEHDVDTTEVGDRLVQHPPSGRAVGDIEVPHKRLAGIAFGEDVERLDVTIGGHHTVTPVEVDGECGEFSVGPDAPAGQLVSDWRR